MPSIRHIKNTSATVFFATLLLCVGVKASDISPKAPTELFGLKIENHCKDLGQPYTDLKKFLRVGSGPFDFSNPTQRKQCITGNLDFNDGFQSEFYIRENSGRSEAIELFFTPDMKLWRINLITRWDASNGPTLKATIDSLLLRFGSPILVKDDKRSIQDNRTDEQVSQGYKAMWSTRTAIKKQVDASINLKLCAGISQATENFKCSASLWTRSSSLWDTTASQLGGIVTKVDVGSTGRAERTDGLWISMQDSAISEKYYEAISRQSKRSQKHTEEYLKKSDQEKIPNF
jgi:hypothetical protein